MSFKTIENLDKRIEETNTYLAKERSGSIQKVLYTILENQKVIMESLIQLNIKK